MLFSCFSTFLKTLLLLEMQFNFEHFKLQNFSRIFTQIDIIFRLHRRITYTDAVYCYRLSSVVCQLVCHTSEPCKKTVEPIEMPFGLRIRVGPRNHRIMY